MADDHTGVGAAPHAGSVRRVAPDALRELVARTWAAVGAPQKECGLLAEHLVGASLTGHDSHGVGMLPEYLRCLDEGGLVVGGHAVVTRDLGALLAVDGGHALGQVTTKEAMDLAVERARAHGVCVVGLRNTHHLGRVGHWAEQCARAGMASIHLANVAGEALVVPAGGAAGRYGTNPFCAAFPMPGGDPVVLDMATSRLALGKTRVAWVAGQPVAEGALLDGDGQPTTDPAVMWDPRVGALLPFGEHKGAGLAVMCELLGAALVGGVVTQASSLDQPGIHNSMLSVVIDPAAFGSGDPQQAAREFLAWVRQSAPRDEVGVVLPGEPERRARADREAHGIPLPDATWQALLTAARERGADVTGIAQEADSKARAAEQGPGGQSLLSSPGALPGAYSR